MKNLLDKIAGWFGYVPKKKLNDMQIKMLEYYTETNVLRDKMHKRNDERSI